MAVGIGLKAKKLCILAFVIHSLYPFLGDCSCALCVVCNDLSNGDAALVDLTVDQEGGDSCVISLLYCLYGSISACVVADDSCCAVGDGCFKILKLLSSIVVM